MKCKISRIKNYYVVQENTLKIRSLYFLANFACFAFIPPKYKIHWLFFHVFFNSP